MLKIREYIRKCADKLGDPRLTDRERFDIINGDYTTPITANKQNEKTIYFYGKLNELIGHTGQSSEEFDVCGMKFRLRIFKAGGKLWCDLLKPDIGNYKSATVYYELCFHACEVGKNTQDRLASGVIDLAYYTDPSIHSIGSDYGGCLMSFDWSEVGAIPITGDKIKVSLKLQVESIRYGDSSEYKYEQVVNEN